MNKNTVVLHKFMVSVLVLSYEFYKGTDLICNKNLKLFIYQHLIKVKPDIQPIFSKPYRLPRALKNEINNQIDLMLNENIIEPCLSE